MTTSSLITPYTSQQPIDDFGLRFADLLYSVTLTASTDTVLNIPGNCPAYKMVVKTSGEAWMALNQIAVLPTTTVSSTSAEMVNANHVVCREVKAWDAIHFIASTAVNISVVLYSLRTNN